MRIWYNLVRGERPLPGLPFYFILMYKYIRIYIYIIKFGQHGWFHVAGPWSQRRFQHAYLCVLFTNMVSSKCGQVGDGQTMRRSEKETNVSHPFDNDVFVQKKGNLVPKQPCCRYWGCTCTGFGTYPCFHSECSTGMGVQVPKKALILTLTSHPFNFILNCILDVSLGGWKKSCNSS